MPQRIHHMHKKQAEKIGVMLTPEGELVRAFWAERNASTLGNNAPEALEKMREVQDVARNRDAEEQGADDVTFSKLVEQISEPIDGDDDPLKPDVPRNDFSVPFDGSVAHQEGFTAADCPYSSETEDDEEYANFERWNEEFDAAADEATDEHEPHSVVDEKYRAKYAEMGHPTHCGDDLAILLNNLCQTTKEGTDLERFEAICNANGVRLDKYNRTTNGWQGRLRMTGRNLLSRRVFEAGGVVLTPIEGAEPSYQMSQEWLATRKFKRAAE